MQAALKAALARKMAEAKVNVSAASNSAERSCPLLATLQLRRQPGVAVSPSFLLEHLLREPNRRRPRAWICRECAGRRRCGSWAQKYADLLPEDVRLSNKLQSILPRYVRVNTLVSTLE